MLAESVRGSRGLMLEENRKPRIARLGRPVGGVTKRLRIRRVDTLEARAIVVPWKVAGSRRGKET